MSTCEASEEFISPSCAGNYFLPTITTEFHVSLRWRQLLKMTSWYGLDKVNHSSFKIRHHSCVIDPKSKWIVIPQYFIPQSILISGSKFVIVTCFQTWNILLLVYSRLRLCHCVTHVPSFKIFLFYNASSVSICIRQAITVKPLCNEHLCDLFSNVF